MSERIAETYVRVEFPRAVRQQAYERSGGFCECCGVKLQKKFFTFDHTVPARRGGPSTLDNCKVLCSGTPDSCNSRKTYGEDLPGIAAAKRYARRRLPLDIERPPKKPGTIKSRGFAKGGQAQKIPSRPFQPRRPRA